MVASIKIAKGEKCASYSHAPIAPQDISLLCSSTAYAQKFYDYFPESGEIFEKWQVASGLC
jgi:hypothetical protein